MDEIEIKQEIPSFDYQCRVCLSVGRKLSPLGEYTDVFKRIIADIEYHKHDIIESVKLCWECVAVLQRVHTFLQRARSAQQTLHSAEFVYGSLSSLAAIILNDTHAHTVYVYEPCVRVGSECERAPSPHGDHSDHNDHCGDDVPLGDECGDDVMVLSEELPAPVPATTAPKKPKSNRWATKRTLQNKKPKFKIITDYTEDCFKKIQIKNEDVLSYLQSERDSEYFKSKKFKCSPCVKTFVDEKSLNEHNIKYHDKLGGLCCDVCGARVRSKRRLGAHVRAHYRRYACALCAFSCGERARRGPHARRAHRRVFQCLKCHLKFGSRKEFFKHYKEWHERFICEHCGVSFKMRYCIKNHLRKQHSPFECKPCNKRFARYNGLWLHNKTTHPASALPTPAYCVECDRRYPDVYRYRWHLANSARHNRTNKVRVACPGCDKVFSKNIYMKDHYNLVHLKHYKYRCEQCDKNFIRNAELVKHRRRVHEGVLPPKNKICYMCGRGFSTNKILMNHMRTHTGERPHACSVCGARFAQRTTLAAHHRAIHRKQP